jgi:hypothetical protein
LTYLVRSDGAHECRGQKLGFLVCECNQNGLTHSGVFLWRHTVGVDVGCRGSKEMKLSYKAENVNTRCWKKLCVDGKKKQSCYEGIDAGLFTCGKRHGEVGIRAHG